MHVGTAVSAKYKGAFCEAKVSKVVRIVKCKVTFKMGLGTATVSDEVIKGPIRVGQLVNARHPEKKENIDCIITKIQDCSQYTVVFDDGDITTLRRSALCLKSGRHFNESETLDQLPLTHPEHFGNPVMGGRRGRRCRQLKEDSSDGEGEEENEPDLEMYSADIGRVVVIEGSDKKRIRDNWFPGLIVIPSAQPTVRINVKDEFLVRSFRDGRYYTVPKKEIMEFKRESKADMSCLKEAIEKALKYMDQDELPPYWERNSLFNSQSQLTDSDDNYSDSSDDEPTEEKDHFVAQLYKFMDDRGTPLNKTPTIAQKDVDFYKLFRLVHKMGGYNRVSNKTKWKSVTGRLKLPQTQSAYNQVKQVYKKCLLSYEAFYRTLGCTMLTPIRHAKKDRGRPLIRDKDRMTPVQSPKPEKEKEEEPPEIKKEKEEDEKEKKEDVIVKTPKPKKAEKPVKVEDEKKNIKKEPLPECSDNSSDATDQSEVAGPSREPGRPKRSEVKKEKKVKPASGDKVKALVEKFEEHTKKNEKEKDKDKEKVKDDDKDKDKEREKDKDKEKQSQQTRSKSSQQPKTKDKEKEKEKESSPESRAQDVKTPVKDKESKSSVKSAKKSSSDDDKERKRGRKRTNPEEKEKTSSESSDLPPTPSTSTTKGAVNIGEKLKVYYGPTHESKVTYEAKVIEIDKDNSGQFMYLVHYTGWNNRYDEWINAGRIAENLSATSKAKRLRQHSSPPTGAKSSPKPPVKRGRGMSITGRSTVQETPRSTTPSSVTSSSSRTKSPATPVSRSRSTRGESTRRTRRTSAHTDISVQSESDSDDDDRTESDIELTRTRSGNKSEENETKVKRKHTKSKSDKRKDDEDTEKEDDEKEKPKKPRKYKKVAEIKSDSEDEAVLSTHAKGRDFDLLQIRSELKGFRKAELPATTVAESNEKDTTSSDESATLVDSKEREIESENEDKKEKIIEKSSSSDDIYEFKEPEPFEFGSRKIVDDKIKKRVPRVFEEVEKSPPKKKTPKSPAKQETKEEPEKKRFKKLPASPKPVVEEIQTPPEEKEIEVKKEVKEEKREVSDDPFDKLVESPSFHVGKSTTTTPEKAPVEKPKVEPVPEPLSMFDSPDFEENSDDRLDLSDNEERTNELTFTRASPLFTNFGKPSPDHIIEAACDSFGLSKGKDIKQKDSEDDEDSNLQASIQRAQSALTNHLDSSPGDAESTKIISESSAITLSRVEAEDVEMEIVDEPPMKEKVQLPKQISAVFQESDSSILEDLYNPPQIVIPKAEDIKDLNVKTGTKIADSILQKLTKNKEIVSPKSIKVEEPPIMVQQEIKAEESPEVMDTKGETKIITLVEATCKPDTKSITKVDSIDELPVTPPKSKPEPKPKPQPVKRPEPEPRKRSYKKFVSPEFIDSDDDSDDSDSDIRLVIARSEDESESGSSSDKLEPEEQPTETKVIKLVDAEEPEERNFNITECKMDFKEAEEEEVKTDEPEEESKEEEPDSQLHSTLLCEETFPGSPAPAPTSESKPKTKAVMEMPFASAPSSSSSNSKSVMMQQEKQPSPGPIILPLPNNRDTNTVLDNTPPTTPESTISNLSPRGEIGGLSPPSNADNESCKSTEAENDYSTQRRAAATKVTNYSEEDSLNCEPHTSAKKREEIPSPCKKRRRSCKGENDVPAKRGRKPNRSRHNSDSDDTSEHSLNALMSSFESRLTRSPRPLKYNFYVELDPNLDSAARIAVLLQKLQDLRKTYADVKAELVTIERRRKKIRRREREALKAAKQEMACI